MLEIKQLTKTYPGGTRALRGIDLQVGKGMFGLLGPNGAGKSTLMRTIATLQEPDHGHIQFDGEDVLQDPRQLRLRLGYLPQEFGVYPRVSALQLLDHLAVLKGIRDKQARSDQIHSLLEQTNLLAVKNRSVRSFSGGMKQRFGIAQALLGNPGLIIVDEPTAGLDPEERSRFLNLLSDIGQNVVVILSTHIVEDVSDLCTRLAIMVEGRVVLAGSPDALVQDLEGKVWQRTFEHRDGVTLSEGCTQLSSQLHAGKSLVRVLSEGDPGFGFKVSQPRLQDVYFWALKSSLANPK